MERVEGASLEDYVTGTTITGKGEFTLSLTGGTEDYQKALNYDMKQN